MNEVETTESNGYQIFVSDIKWNSDAIGNYRSKNKNIELPTQFTFDLPENVLNRANKKTNVFNDIVETFVYDFLTRKFGHEVYHCQIWLPLENEQKR